MSDRDFIPLFLAVLSILLLVLIAYLLDTRVRANHDDIREIRLEMCEGDADCVREVLE